MLTFCSHLECLDRELRFLTEIEYSVWQQSPVLESGYRVLLLRFRDDFAGQALHHES